MLNEKQLRIDHLNIFLKGSKKTKLLPQGFKMGIVIWANKLIMILVRKVKL